MSVQELSDAEVWERWKALDRDRELAATTLGDTRVWDAAITTHGGNAIVLDAIEQPTPEAAMRSVLEQLEEQG